VVETINMGEFRLPPGCRWRLHCCGSLCSLCVYLFTDVSGQPSFRSSRFNNPEVLKS